MACRRSGRAVARACVFSQSRSPSPATASCAKDGALSGYRLGWSSVSALCSNARRGSKFGMDEGLRPSRSPSQGKSPRAIASRPDFLLGPNVIEGQSMPAIPERIAALDWQRLAAELDADGYAIAPALVARMECAALTETLARRSQRFRSRIVMTRHGFGRGEYKYFALSASPETVAELRTCLYPHLAVKSRTAGTNAWTSLYGFHDAPRGFSQALSSSRPEGANTPTPPVR